MPTNFNIYGTSNFFLKIIENLSRDRSFVMERSRLKQFFVHFQQMYIHKSYFY